ncbi:hypothetical protein OHA21_21430 [Actinoplanes sp. NBC_00393]|uniref:hypothetical protein n=1 Tax=Actinoplanes sp. NBC_00393 TaxID=2975953 RepID=UPI002E23473B
MAKVKIGKTDHETFREAAAAAGVTVGQWLAEAGRRQALIQTITEGRPGARIIHVPVDAATATALDDETSRTGLPDWAYAARCLRDVVAGPVVDPEELWTAAATWMSRDPHAKVLDDVWVDSVVGDTVLLVAADSFTRDVIEARLRPTIAAALSRHLHRPVQVAVTIAAPSVAAAKPKPARNSRALLLEVQRTLDELRRRFDGPTPST